MHGHLNVNLSRCTVNWTPFYHDARSPKRQFITMHGHLNVNLSRCTVTWRSDCSLIYLDKDRLLNLEVTTFPVLHDEELGASVSKIIQCAAKRVIILRIIANVNMSKDYHSFCTTRMENYISTISADNGAEWPHACLLIRAVFAHS